jgi:hypothetical protein
MSAKNLHEIEGNWTFCPRWLINNDDRSSFGDQESNADADRVFDVRDSLGVSQCRCWSCLWRAGFPWGKWGNYQPMAAVVTKCWANRKDCKKAGAADADRVFDVRDSLGVSGEIINQWQQLWQSVEPIERSVRKLKPPMLIGSLTCGIPLG